MAMIEVAKRIALRAAERAASRYIAGPAATDALALASRQCERGFTFTIGYWDDGKTDPADVAARHHEALDRIEESGLDCALSVKLPALKDRHHLVAAIVEHARRLGVQVIFDSHAPEASDAIFDAIQRVGADGVGCAIPGRWRRSLDDVERAIELGIRVRVVKGEWPDPEDPRMDMREGYLAIIDRLAGRATFVGIATHDTTLAPQAIDRLMATATPCEQELLFPLPVEPVRQSARAAGIGTRLYIPYGSGWLPYSLAKALRNPRIVFRLMRDLIEQEAPVTARNGAGTDS